MFSQSCDLNFIWKWPRVNSQDSQRFDFMMGGKGFCVELGERYQPPAMIAHDRHGDGSVQLGERSPWLGQNLTFARDCLWVLLQRQCCWAYCSALCHGDALTHRACVVQDHWQFHRIRSLTCSLKSQDLVSNWTVARHPRETCPETASQATGHQRARWYSPGGIAPVADYHEHEALLSRMPAFERLVETSVKVMYWHIANSKSGSSHMSHYIYVFGDKCVVYISFWCNFMKLKIWFKTKRFYIIFK